MWRESWVFNVETFSIHEIMEEATCFSVEIGVWLSAARLLAVGSGEISI